MNFKNPKFMKANCGQSNLVDHQKLTEAPQNGLLKRQYSELFQISDSPHPTEPRPVFFQIRLQGITPFCVLYLYL
jgi:hypothetical protein